MGCDIHAVFQARASEGEPWRDIETAYEGWRNYELFAVLADVRNQFGVQPIASPRGLPTGFAMGGDCGEDHADTWMGDHSHSWLTGAELLSWAEGPHYATLSGIIGREAYRAWDGSCPHSYSQGVSGPGLRTVVDTAEERASGEWTHIRVSWRSDLRENCADFLDAVRTACAKHAQVRVVFGFDS
jgi:hypothetical protein